MTPEQQEALENILKQVEESRRKPMKCLICEDATYDRGLVCAGPAPASVILYGLCYPCKNLPNFDQEIQRKTVEFLIAIGREDLLPDKGDTYE